MARQLADGLWLLDLGIVTPLATNVYLVDERERDVGDDVTLVDTGLPVNYPSMRSELESAGYEPGDLDRVLLTHYDLDHVGGLGRLQPLDCPVFMGQRDVALARGEWDPPLFHHKGAFHRLVRPVFDLDGVDLRPVADGQQVGGFTAHHTPGHNPGHVVYLHEGFDAAFLGDLVWRDGDGYTTPFWLDSYDMRELRESVRELAATAPDFEFGLVAHGEPLRTGGAAKLRALADSFR